jgi:hypothetical protein
MGHIFMHLVIHMDWYPACLVLVLQEPNSLKLLACNKKLVLIRNEYVELEIRMLTSLE